MGERGGIVIYNRIPVTFGQLSVITGATISYQYDVVQLLVINGLDLPDYYTVDFCNVGDTETITVTGTPEGVRIPDDLLLDGRDIEAYIILTGIDEGAVETRYKVTLPVRNRPMRQGVTPTPEERIEIETLVNALNDGVTRAEDAATDAETQADRAETAADNAQSAVEHYPKIEDGYWYVWLNGGWVSTGVKAEGVDGKGIASVTGQKTSTSGLVDTYTLTVTYTDSTTDTITFTVTNGRDGTDGTDGVSPGVTITDITGGHRVTITDKDHPTGQSFDVMDGEVSQSDLDAALATKAPVIIDTASGAIASFPDGADAMPIKALTVSIEPLQSGTGDPSPTNVRPISGWTGLSLTRDGVNFFDKSILTEQATWQTVILSLPVGTVTMSTNKPDNNGLVLYLRKTGETGLSGTNSVYSGHNVSVTLADGETAEVVFRQSSGSDSFANYNYQINLGSSASPYEEFNGETVSVDWQTEAGTVYGGTDEIVSGALTSKMGAVDMGDLTWTYSTSSGHERFTSNALSPSAKPAPGSTLAYAICSMYKTATSNQVYSHSANCIFCIDGNGKVQVYDSGYIDATAFKTAVTGQKIVYELAQSVEYQLDPITISTLYGQNNIFADTGDTTVEYPADTKLYIEKLTAPTEDDMIANANIAANKFFMIGNTLYLSTAAIAQGATIVPGTNCNKVSLADALNTLNA